MNTHNPANDHWPKVRPLRHHFRHNEVAMKCTQIISHDIHGEFPVSNYHVISCYIPILDRLSQHMSYLQFWFLFSHQMMVHSKISPCFPVFLYESPFLRVNFNPVLMVIYPDLFPISHGTTVEASAVTPGNSSMAPNCSLKLSSPATFCWNILRYYEDSLLMGYNIWKSMKINEFGLQYMQINEDQWIWATIYGKLLWRSMNFWYYFLVLGITIYGKSNQIPWFQTTNQTSFFFGITLW